MFMPALVLTATAVHRSWNKTRTMLGFPCGTLEGKVPVRVYLKGREFDAEIHSCFGHRVRVRALCT